MYRHNLAQRILLTLPLVAAVHMAIYYPQLPERMATHFGPNGQADGWMSKSAFTAFFLLMITFMTAMMSGIGTLIRVLPPEVINLPNKEYWLAPERRVETAARFAREMAAFGIALDLFLIATVQLTFQANLDGTERLNLPVFLTLFGSFFAFLIVWLIRIFLMHRRP